MPNKRGGHSRTPITNKRFLDIPQIVLDKNHDYLISILKHASSTRIELNEAGDDFKQLNFIANGYKPSGVAHVKNTMERLVMNPENEFPWTSMEAELFADCVSFEFKKGEF